MTTPPLRPEVADPPTTNQKKKFPRFHFTISFFFFFFFKKGKRYSIQFRLEFVFPFSPTKKIANFCFVFCLSGLTCHVKFARRETMPAKS
jgi:hypothetical protein